LYKIFSFLFRSSGEILSEIFSLSFTSLKDSQELVEPVQIIFKVAEKEVS